MAFTGNILPGYYLGIDLASGPSWTAYISQRANAYEKLKQMMSVNCITLEQHSDIYPHPQHLTHTYEFKVVRMNRNEFRLFSRIIWRYHDSYSL